MESYRIIQMIHLGFIAWMIYAPFSGIDEHILMHAIICPFLMLHWIVNSNGCFLTMVEKHLRGLECDDESFIHKIVAPIYVIDDATLKPMVFGATLGLWWVSLRQLSPQKIKDMFTVKKTETDKDAP
jgi:hypothetical protein